jgi:hypothetical protein
MKNIFLTFSVLVINFIIFGEPILANSSCEKAIDSSEIELGSAAFSVNIVSLEGRRQIFTTNRPLSVTFLLQNASSPFYSRSSNVLNSPKFKLAIAKRIIDNCENVGLVQFGMVQTGTIFNYGIINGRVREFEE